MTVELWSVGIGLWFIAAVAAALSGHPVRDGLTVGALLLMFVTAATTYRAGVTTPGKE